MAPANSTTHLSPAELSYLHTSLSSNPPIRPDARNATDFRPFSAETGVLPNTFGSAHVGFADGREAVVGVRAEVEKTLRAYIPTAEEEEGDDVQMADSTAKTTNRHNQGRASWVNLALTLSGLRDDDKDLIFLEEMLREVLVSPSSGQMSVSLQDSLVINSRWHWRLYIDVVLISPPSSSATGGSYPLPLLSMAIHLALRDTRIPRLKSEGEEDPLADDDWEASRYLYVCKDSQTAMLQSVPPVTLLVTVTGDNTLFDPSEAELSVADAVFAVSIGRSQDNDTPTLLSMRTLETGARDTMRGVPNKDDTKEWEVVPGVWRPKIGGVKRTILNKVLKEVLGETGKDVLRDLGRFAI